MHYFHVESATFDKQTLALALARECSEVRTEAPEPNHYTVLTRPGTAEACALQDVDLRLSKGLRKASDQRHAQGDGHAEPQVVHSHHLRCPTECYGCKH